MRDHTLIKELPFALDPPAHHETERVRDDVPGQLAFLHPEPFSDHVFVCADALLVEFIALSAKPFGVFRVLA